MTPDHVALETSRRMLLDVLGLALLRYWSGEDGLQLDVRADLEDLLGRQAEDAAVAVATVR